MMAEPSRQSLNRLALSAPVHCLTGCAIGEVLGMILATWWAWGNFASILLSVVLAFFFGGRGHAVVHGHHAH